MPVVFGTDLLGHMHDEQSREFALRAPVQSAAEILQGATHVAAQLLRAEGQIGTLAAGALADVLLVDGNPTATVDLWADAPAAIRLLVQGGRVVKRTL